MEETKQNYNKFLGTEKIGKLLRMFAIPCVLSLVIQAFYNIVDQIFIGKSPALGDLGNTATGIVYPLTVIALAIGLFIGDGTAACISISQGKGQIKNVHKTIGTAVVVSLMTSIILLAISFGLRDQILFFFGANEFTFEFAAEYSIWIIAGFPFFILTTVLNPIIRSDGSPKFAMFAMAIGAVINIILDPIFIFGMNMGMTGAALATFIAQVVSCVVSVAYLFKSKSFKLTLKSFCPNFKLLFTSLKLGISSFLTQIAIVIVSIVNNNMLRIYLPNDNSAIGLLTIAFKVFGIIISIAIGIACGGQPIVGYNYGAKKLDRVKETLKLTMIITAIVGIIATILFEACPQFIIRIFSDSQISSFGINTFRIYLSLILLTCMTKAASIFFQSIGMPVKSTLIGMLRDVIFLVPLAVLLPLWGGIDLFLWSAPISDILTTIVTVILLAVLLKQLHNAESTTIVKRKIAIRKSKPGVIVTISREHGAGGREIGQKLAKTLGVPFYDKEVAMIAAQESGLADEFIENVEDKSSLLYSIYLSSDVNQMAISAQEKALKTIAENGACVIVGRAADYVLEGYELCKVHIYAPIEFKKARIMKNYGDDEKQAIQNAEKSDKRRAMFYKNVTGNVWGEKENYNLCINSSIGIDKTVKIICEYLKK